MFLLLKSYADLNWVSLSRNSDILKRINQASNF